MRGHESFKRYLLDVGPEDVELVDVNVTLSQNAQADTVSRAGGKMMRFGVAMLKNN